ncbi:MAG: Jag N-terminal domain-containing protein [Deltaproteobacteria bacterium]|nr:Jag N-terminal domain-containing protein [Deltaproteobacteria bacterium]MBW2050985.1 Jag N-terminal domain-containing protein [Deltaproteobacteria bacterium]MBW2141751.1 Jag N-terminal domain-containing protein [Deltaproteobacteria bacterium]MBW2323849.1 Jag N-terminal domain-containing protein [Deltaproteobacteria bacterium]
MPTLEFAGKTTEEAIEKACSQLHLAKDELRFEIISTGTSGIFGLLTGKKARIKVIIEEKLSTPAKAEKPEPSPRTYKASPDKAPAPKEAEARRQRAKGRKETDRKKQAAEPAKKSRPAEAAAQQDEPALHSPTQPGPGEELYAGPEGEAMKQAREVLEGILKRMPVEADVAVSRINDRIILNIEGDSSGLLIGKKGATLDAFQFLVNKIVNRSRSDRNHIIIDTGDYRTRRHESLMGLVQRMADKARDSNRPVSINALSAHDRRIVHLALKNEPGLVTRSKGEGSYKKIVIFPNRGSQGQRNARKNNRNDSHKASTAGRDLESAEGEGQEAGLGDSYAAEGVEPHAFKE